MYGAGCDETSGALGTADVAIETAGVGYGAGLVTAGAIVVEEGTATETWTAVGVVATLGEAAGGVTTAVVAMVLTIVLSMVETVLNVVVPMSTYEARTEGL